MVEDQSLVLCHVNMLNILVVTFKFDFAIKCIPELESLSVFLVTYSQVFTAFDKVVHVKSYFVEPFSPAISMSMVFIMGLIAVILHIIFVYVEQTPINIFIVALTKSIINFWMPLCLTSIFYGVMANRICKSIKGLGNIMDLLEILSSDSENDDNNIQTWPDFHIYNDERLKHGEMFKNCYILFCGRG
uniref:Uncharacterized protein n=1 Tax=Romanomermis culicivorax TaxID=13658 RepID=A0A915K803_ROMCU